MKKLLFILIGGVIIALGNYYLTSGLDDFLFLEKSNPYYYEHLSNNHIHPYSETAVFNLLRSDELSEKDISIFQNRILYDYFMNYDTIIVDMVDGYGYFVLKNYPSNVIYGRISNNMVSRTINKLPFTLFFDSALDDSNKYRERIALNNIVDLNVYLEAVKDPRYIVFISAKDDATFSLNDEVISRLMSLGIELDFGSHFRDSIVAICHKEGTIVKASDQPILENGDWPEYDLSYSVYSAGDKCGNLSSIEINGVDYSVNERGLNIVVYDTDSRKIIDSVAFDTYKTLDATRKKEFVYDE